MKRVVIAGVSGAIGGALAAQLIERDSQIRVIGLCREPERAPKVLRAHERSTVLPWDAQDAESPAAGVRMGDAGSPAWIRGRCAIASMEGDAGSPV